MAQRCGKPSLKKSTPPKFPDFRARCTRALRPRTPSLHHGTPESICGPIRAALIPSACTQSARGLAAGDHELARAARDQTRATRRQRGLDPTCRPPPCRAAPARPAPRSLSALLSPPGPRGLRASPLGHCPLPTRLAATSRRRQARKGIEARYVGAASPAGYAPRPARCVAVEQLPDTIALQAGRRPQRKRRAASKRLRDKSRKLLRQPVDRQG